MPPIDSLFSEDYYQARARFGLALDDFERHVGRRFIRRRHLIDEQLDLSIDTAEMRPQNTLRLYAAVSGIHGVEGFAGSAIQHALLMKVLPRFDLETSGVLLVHGLNPTGMHHRRRVNRNNVDLNRNFALSDDCQLYASDSRAYGQIAALLEPTGPCTDPAGHFLRFLLGVAIAVVRHGFKPLRQATLAGQYAFPAGLFYGGKTRELEAKVFDACFRSACLDYREILLTDLHTGYGARAQVSALFGRADSPEFKRFTADGVTDRRGLDQGYAARGDLVAYCEATARQLNPGVLFNGTVVEVGTTGLGVRAQLRDLFTLIRENQLRHHGSARPELGHRVQRAFDELFNPDDRVWRSQTIDEALERIQHLLASRDFV